MILQSNTESILSSYQGIGYKTASENKKMWNQQIKSNPVTHARMISQNKAEDKISILLHRFGQNFFPLL
jgi:hypothetical protein